MTHRFCPRCGGPLIDKVIDQYPRQMCADPNCDHVFWGNPTPVVAAVVEHEGDVILARNANWPVGMLGLITGFLEAQEDPAVGVVREVREELGLAGRVQGLIGAYPFRRMNQVILAYHVSAEGEIRLNEELAEYKRMQPATMRYWPLATGWALKHWLEARGHTPEPIEIPDAMREPPPD